MAVPYPSRTRVALTCSPVPSTTYRSSRPSASMVVAGRVAVEPDGGARESGGGVGGGLGAVGFDAPRRVCRLGRVHAGQPDGTASPIEPDADGVAVDHPVHLGGAGLCEDWPAGQPREDREGDDVRPEATRPYSGLRSSRSISHALLPAS